MASEAGQKWDRIAVRHLRKKRQEASADIVAEDLGIGIGFIVDWFEIKLRTHGVGLASAEAEDRMPRTRFHRPEAADPCSTEQVDQHRLRLIVHGVPGGHPRWQYRSSGAPRRLFEVRGRTDVHPMRHHISAKPLRKTLDHCDVSATTWADPMVNVVQDDGSAGGGCQNCQSSGVRSPRAGNFDCAGPRAEGASAEEVFDEHRGIQRTRGAREFCHHRVELDERSNHISGSRSSAIDGI
jgi:hypothetical protein